MSAAFGGLWGRSKSYQIPNGAKITLSYMYQGIKHDAENPRYTKDIFEFDVRFSHILNYKKEYPALTKEEYERLNEVVGSKLSKDVSDKYSSLFNLKKRRGLLNYWKGKNDSYKGDEWKAKELEMLAGISRIANSEFGLENLAKRWGLVRKYQQLKNKELNATVTSKINNKLTKDNTLLDAINAIGEKEGLTYPDFKEKVQSIMDKLLLNLLTTELTELIRGRSQFRLTLYIFDEYNSDNPWRAGFSDVYSEDGDIIIYLNGHELFGKVYLPFKYLNRFDSGYFLRLLSHELQHSLQWLNKVYEKQDKMEDAVENFSGMKLPRYGKKFLFYYITYMLFTEGAASLREKRNMTAFNYKFTLIMDHLELMEKMAASGSALKAKQIYDDVFAATSEVGEYFLGYMMANTIALSIMKDRRSYFNTAYKNNQLIDKYKTEAKISVLSPEKITVPFDSLGSYIIKKGDVVIEKPDEQSYYDALQKFNNMSTNIDFIREYTLACDNLRFPKKIRILDTSRFLSFVKKFSKDN